MSRTESIHEELSAYLDGELAEHRRQVVEQAIAADGDLAAELRRLRRTRDMVRRLPRLRLGEDFAATLLSQAERDRLADEDHSDEDRATAPAWLRHVATAAIVLITVGAGIGIALTLLAGNQVATGPGEGAADRISSADAPGDTGAASDLVAATETEPRQAAVPPRRYFALASEDLSAVNADVQRVLMASGVSPVLDAPASVADQPDPLDDPLVRQILGTDESTYLQRTDRAGQVQIVAQVTPEQLDAFLQRLGALEARMLAARKRTPDDPSVGPTMASPAEPRRRTDQDVIESLISDSIRTIGHWVRPAEEPGGDEANQQADANAGIAARPDAGPVAADMPAVAAPGALATVRATIVTGQPRRLADRRTVPVLIVLSAPTGQTGQAD